MKGKGTSYPAMQQHLGRHLKSSPCPLFFPTPHPCSRASFGVAPLFLRGSRLMGFTVGLLAVSSHILLDAMTNGGLGVAAFWPFDQTRYFCDWRPIRVSPFGLKGLLSQRGLSVMLSELRWVWAPCLAVIAAALFFGKNPMRAIPRK